MDGGFERRTKQGGHLRKTLITYIIVATGHLCRPHECKRKKRKRPRGDDFLCRRLGEKRTKRGGKKTMWGFARGDSCMSLQYEDRGRGLEEKIKLQHAKKCLGFKIKYLGDVSS
jgi:hypothetical protein